MAQLTDEQVDRLVVLLPKLESILTRVPMDWNKFTDKWFKILIPILLGVLGYFGISTKNIAIDANTQATAAHVHAERATVQSEENGKKLDTVASETVGVAKEINRAIDRKKDMAKEP